jgi:selenide,water dikinase
MAPDALAQVLRPLQQMFPAEQYPQLLVGLGPDDDAAVYKINDELALIATLDFFTPIVDDPYQYGAIAAANSLSDIYAMGGQFALALNICCLSECLPTDVISEILRGGADKVLEAGGVLVGGHSVDDKEPKYGLAAIGFAHPDRIFTTTAARPGDALVLTKPLGVGIVTTAAKADQAEAEHIEASIESMLQLNRAAAGLLQDAGVRACTDVTGFALLGHASDFAQRSGVRFRFYASRIPFVPGAQEYADLWLFPNGTARNKAAFARHVQVDAGVVEDIEQLLYTPETSGGLLAAVPAERLDELNASFSKAGEPLWVIGEVVEGEGTEVTA